MAVGDAKAGLSPQASDVLTRNELLAMMPQGKRRARETEAACLPAVVPCSSLARHASRQWSSVPHSPARSNSTRMTQVAAVSTGVKQGASPLISDAENNNGTDEDRDFQLRVLAAAEKLSNLGEGAGPEVTLLMQELEELAQRIAKADEMRKQAAASPPARDGEAAKWHDVALVTLDWSQQEPLKRQKAALLRLIEIAEQPTRKVTVQSSKPCRST